jgi:hypothetical protein
MTIITDALLSFLPSSKRREAGMPGLSDIIKK